eukprot:scaffold235778_cov17-Tisochrysis_lutea.AAC.1
MQPCASKNILVNFIARGNTASEWGPVLNEVLPMRKRAGRLRRRGGKDTQAVKKLPSSMKIWRHLPKLISCKLAAIQ